MNIWDDGGPSYEWYRELSESRQEGRALSIRAIEEEWAAEVLADPRTAVLDTETTGLYGYACEVTVMAPDGRLLLDTLVNPLTPVEAGARRVHRISDEQLTAAPAFKEVWPELAPLLRDRRIVIWNAEFDTAVLSRELARLGHPAAVPAECAMRHYSNWHWDMEDGRFVRLNGGHRAAADCAATFERLREMTL